MYIHIPPFLAMKNAEILKCEFGRGIFSTCFMPAYTQVLAEDPLCSMKYGDMVQFSDVVSEKLLSLHHTVAFGESPELSAFHKNAFAVDYDTGLSSVYYHGSFFNHSCLPNCHVYIIENRLYVYTMQPIQKGEQLFISYINSFVLTREQRRVLLARSWDFDCMCCLCSDNFRSRRYAQFVDACKSPGLYSISEMEAMMDTLAIPRTHYVRRVTLAVNCLKQIHFVKKPVSTEKFLAIRFQRGIRRFHRDVKDFWGWQHLE